MPLPLPNLDDRRWADLVDEGRALIPRHAPGWTDHNIHDPGITLIELFAWLTEMAIYRLNRIPDRHRRKFLALIGFNPQPPRAAQTTLTFDPDAGTPPFLLPSGVEFQTTEPNRPPVRFRTLRDVTVAVMRPAALQVDAGDGNIRDHTRDWRDGLPIDLLGRDPQPGAAFYLGLSVLPAQIPLSFACRFQGPGNDSHGRDRIVREAAAQRSSCLPILPDITCLQNEVEQLEEADMLPPHHSARIAWEVFTGEAPNLWTRLGPAKGVAHPAVGEVNDDTRSLTLDGIIEVNLPSNIAQTTRGEVVTPLFYIRGRLAAGTYDARPILTDVAPNGVVAEQAVPAWQAFTFASGVTPAGLAPSPGTSTRLSLQLDPSGVVEALTFHELNASDGPDITFISYDSPVEGSVGRITLELVLVGVSNGQPAQRFRLPDAPVQIDSLQLYAHVGNDWLEYTRRDHLDASDRTHRHFVLDAMSGEIGFGNGERGRVPPAGVRILASYRSTRAALGNVGATRVNQPASTPVNSVLLANLEASARDQLHRITGNRVPATGGATVESLAAVTGRAIETLYAHERLLHVCAEAKCQTLDQVDKRRVRTLVAPTRAVNLLDIERLALDVPGTRVARARAWEAVHPGYPGLQAAGVVTLVILPDTSVAKPDPSKGLLEAIRRYLDQRRILCTRLEVVGPHYLEVHVNVRVRTLLHIDKARVRAEIRQSLNAFLDPRTGGPDGMGWPFGRDVYRTEILQLIDGVPGVDHVLELSLSGGKDTPRCGNVSLCPTWLVTPGQHQIVVNSPSTEEQTRDRKISRPCRSPEAHEPFIGP